MSEKRKRKRLTFAEKFEIIKEVKAGASKRLILGKYGISGIVYDRLIDSESELLEKVKNFKYEKKKSTKTSDNIVLDTAMITWFTQARDRGDPISGAIIKEKACILNKKLGGPPTFKASCGWLDRFKKRYGIQNARMKGEKLSNDHIAAAEFSQFLNEKIMSEDLNLHNIYNADESGILWRLLMACTLALHLEEEVSSRKESKDLVTALFCSNATGSHRIPLLTIGKSKTPQCLSNLINEKSKDECLKKFVSLVYTYQRNAWMDKFIFMLWFKDEFIPRVLEHQRTSGITGKVILILDNAPFHPSLEELNAVNENFEVVYLPLNVTTLIQPMNQGVIGTTKKLFKKNLLRCLLLSDKPEGAVKFLKDLNLKDCFAMLSYAWDSVKPSTLQKAWKALLGDSFVPNSVPGPDNFQDPLSNIKVDVDELESSIDLPSFPYEICDRVSQELSGPDYSVEESREFLLKWFENDQNDTDCGWESLSDSDIVNFVTNDTCKLETVSEIEESKTIFGNPDPLEITREEAFEGLMKFKSWMKSRAESSSIHLRHIQELEDVINPNIYETSQNYLSL